MAASCDGVTVEAPALRKAPLEGAHSDAAEDVDADTAAETTATTSPNAATTFDEELERLMAESEAFRNAIASIRLFDSVLEGFVRAEVIEPARRMTCNEPPSPAELERAPAVEVRGDPQRHVGLLARLGTLKPGDLATDRDLTSDNNRLP